MPEPKEPKIVDVGGTKVEAGSQAYWVMKGEHERKVKLEEFKNKFKKFVELYQRSFAHNLSDEETVQNETERAAILSELETELEKMHVYIED